MSELPGALSRVVDPAGFRADPFGFLAAARAAHGDVFVVRDGGPMFARDPACPGAIAVFGAALRAVLGDIDAFGMPVSAARQLGLPPAVVNLTRGLHTMIGDDHAAQRRIVAAALTEATAPATIAAAVAPAVAAALATWRPGAELALLATMRELAVAVAGRLLFGDRPAAELLELLDTFFAVRREVSAGAAGAAETAVLTAVGEALDAALRAHVRTARPGVGGICDRLATSGLDEDAVVAHSNVLFVSSTEPVAAALTWILLVGSQRPPAAPLDHVIHECLRLLPPNAMMTRVATRAAALGDVVVPAGTEVIVCPLVVQRDPARFRDPAVFDPARWAGPRPSPFDYLPFGAGGHACAGRALALAMLRAVLGAIAERFALGLTEGQSIDWQLHIQLLPRVDPIMHIRTVTAATPPGAAWRGTVADLVKWTRLDS